MLTCQKQFYLHIQTRKRKEVEKNELQGKSDKKEKYLPHSSGVFFPAPHPPSPTEPSLSQYHSAPSQSAPLEYDKTLPDIKQKNLRVKVKYR